MFTALSGGEFGDTVNENWNAQEGRYIKRISQGAQHKIQTSSENIVYGAKFNGQEKPARPKNGGEKNVPRKEAKESKGCIKSRASVGLVFSVDLTTATQTRQRIEHAGTHETNDTKQSDLDSWVGMDSPPS